ncbi:peptide chain release factor 1 [Caldinitratiruptor microaerophilus]|uniref:Peptide chain release factor 1 n=1 Tax=Caldinitratiruptor microaerophilus TaxID=671077 RepID=A0AA35CPN3_9FIRM|nr:peptide chain release factor 1 [Caldinitratiruptor microaerophilus]BDG61782.1 peptide chain release factor 1 [Caldinitratiruptor microaerophilus]
MLETAVLSKLDEVEKRFRELEEQMASPAALADPRELQRLGREHRRLGPIVEKYREYRKVLTDLEEVRHLLDAGDEELRALARAELESLSAREESLDRELRILLLPRDPNDERNVIMEIRQGTGGEEAALFAADLLRMYTRYAERRRWRVEILDANPTELGGYKEVVFQISGDGAYSRLKFEAGVHRVQRVPETEAQGRIHTSTCTVAVLPEAEEVDVEIDPKDLRIDTLRSGGAGGQHVNKTESAVRITHLPTGIVVLVQDERSQHQNRDKAMRILRARLYDHYSEQARSQEEAARRAQVGTGERAERIRTYNFPENRVSDHRIKLTLYKLDQFLDGDMDEVIDALIMNDQAARLRDAAV